MTEPIPAKQTLIPQYTIRQLLVVTAGCSVVFLVGAQAFQGALWAMALSVGVLAVAATLLVHAAFFGIVWLAYRLNERRHRTDRSESPTPSPAPNPTPASAEPRS